MPSWNDIVDLMYGGGATHLLCHMLQDTRRVLHLVLFADQFIFQITLVQTSTIVDRETLDGPRHCFTVLSGMSALSVALHTMMSDSS